MSKFGRTYKITINPNDGSDLLTIELPFTMQFSVVRGIGANLNTANILIYNLGENTRRRIFQDRFNLSTRRTITLEAGYGDELSKVFEGDIYQANSARQGSNIITVIVARDGGFDTVSTKSSFTLSGGTERELLERLIGDFPNLNQGVIGAGENNFIRPVVIDGNTWERLQTYTNYKAFIDLGQVNILNDNQARQGLVPVINSATGLLETPRKDNASLSVKTLFEPRIIMGQIIEIQSDILPVYDGQYKVTGVKHQGIISNAVGGDCSSQFDVLLGGQLFQYEVVDE